MTDNEIFDFLKSVGIYGYNIEIVESPMFIISEIVKDGENSKLVTRQIDVETSLFNDNTVKVFNNLNNKIYLYRGQVFSNNMGYIRYYAHMNNFLMENRKLKLEKIMKNND